MHKILKTSLIVIFLTTIYACSEDKEIKYIKINGTVKNVLLVAEHSKLTYKEITLSNGKQYRLTPEQVKGIREDFDVELTLLENLKTNEVHSLKITAIPLLGKKVKYPVSEPPVIIGNLNE